MTQVSCYEERGARQRKREKKVISRGWGAASAGRCAGVSSGHSSTRLPCSVRMVVSCILGQLRSSLEGQVWVASRCHKAAGVRASTASMKLHSGRAEWLPDRTQLVTPWTLPQKQHVTSTARSVPQEAPIPETSHFTDSVWQQALAMPSFTFWESRLISETGSCRNHDGCDGWNDAPPWIVPGVILTRGTVIQC